jgi:hypothetical protein
MEGVIFIGALVVLFLGTIAFLTRDKKATSKEQ